jgi:geranylgeranyl diphosphate synthase type II
MYNHLQIKELVDKAIASLSFSTEAGGLIDPVRYFLSMGGKRLRPTLAIMACNMYNDKIDEAVMPAAGIEVFHNFTLIHDDIMDHSSMRRNFPTVHKKWNVNQAILSGDVMAFIANDCFLHTPAAVLPKVFKIFNKAAVDVCIGQQLDIEFEKARIVNQCEYLRMIGLKTAALIAASAKIGGIIGGADAKDSDLLYDFGRNLGLAFQIQDDMLDAFGDSKVFGKTAGGDIIENKKTFLFVKAFETANPAQQKQLRELLCSKELEPQEKVTRVVDLYNELNLKNITENIANSYIDTAFQLLEKVNVDAKRKKEMTNLAGTLIGRCK